MAFPSNRPPSAAHGEQADVCRIGVLEKNRAIGTRIARVISCATGFSDVAVADDPEVLREQLGDEPALLACEAADLPTLLQWVESIYPSAQIVVWTSGAMAPLLERAAMSNRVTSMLGWPSFETIPRSWELQLAARRIVDAELPPPRLAELFG